MKLSLAFDYEVKINRDDATTIGSVVRIRYSHPDAPTQAWVFYVTPNQARALASALVEQADQIEQSAGKQSPVLVSAVTGCTSAKVTEAAYKQSKNKRSPHGDVLYFVGCNPVDGVLYRTANPNGKIMTCTPEHWDALADADGGG